MAVALEDEKKKKALGTEARNKADPWDGLREGAVGAQSAPQSPGAAPEAPTSVGQLMTPSTFGREAPPSNEEELGKRVQRNKNFLSNPDTQAAMLQFGIAMLSTAGRGNPVSNFGQALGLAAGMPGRMQIADRKLSKEAKELELEERRVKIQEGQLGVDEDKLSQESDKKQARKRLFKSLNNISDDKLMEIASELAADGDDEGARLAISMMKQGGDNESTALMKNYNAAVAQGFKGTITDYSQLGTKLTTVEMIRAKIAGGVPLTPGEQQVYDDAINADPLARLLQMTNPELAAPGAGITAPSPTIVAPAGNATGPDEDTIKYNMETYGKTREEVIQAWKLKYGGA